MRSILCARARGLTRTRSRARFTELLTRLLPEPGPGTTYSTEHLITQAHYRLRRLGDHLLAGSGLAPHDGEVQPRCNLSARQLGGSFRCVVI